MHEHQQRLGGLAHLLHSDIVGDLRRAQDELAKDLTVRLYGDQRTADDQYGDLVQNDEPQLGDYDLRYGEQNDAPERRRDGEDEGEKRDDHNGENDDEALPGVLGVEDGEQKVGQKDAENKRDQTTNEFGQISQPSDQRTENAPQNRRYHQKLNEEIEKAEQAENQVVENIVQRAVLSYPERYELSISHHVAFAMGVVVAHLVLQIYEAQLKNQRPVDGQQAHEHGR